MVTKYLNHIMSSSVETFSFNFRPLSLFCEKLHAKVRLTEGGQHTYSRHLKRSAKRESGPKYER